MLHRFFGIGLRSVHRVIATAHALDCVIVFGRIFRSSVNHRLVPSVVPAMAHAISRRLNRIQAGVHFGRYFTTPETDDFAKRSRVVSLIC